MTKTMTNIDNNTLVYNIVTA